MKRFVLALFLSTLVALPMAAAHTTAQTSGKADSAMPDDGDNAGDALKGSLNTLMQLIQKVVKDVPQYEAPEMLDNGDIIIRRKSHSDSKEDTGPVHTSFRKKL